MTVVLDWSKGHTGRRAACWLCGGLTQLRDDLNRPSHKVCAERRRDVASVASPAAAAGLLEPATELVGV